MKHAELAIVVGDSQKSGKGTLHTYFTVEGTGSGSAQCDVEITRSGTKELAGTFSCAPMKLS